jgi:SNF family Na+-dependent transporter
MKGQKQQMEWDTRVGVILAVSGSAVGLGISFDFPARLRRTVAARL